MIREMTAKVAAQLVKDAFKAKGVTVSHTEALDLIARLKGFNAWSHLKSATTVAATVEAALELPKFVVPCISVTNLDGTKGTWVIETNLADRWGDLNFAEREKKPSLDTLADDTALLDALRQELTNEVSFIVRKDGKFGVLIEIEFTSKESEEAASDGSADRFSDCQPHAVVVEALRRGMTALAPMFPQAQFCVPPEEEIFWGRPAAWAFVPHKSMSQSAIQDLSVKMLAL